MWGYDYDLGGRPSFEEIRTNIASKKNIPIDSINDRYIILDLHGDKSFFQQK